MTEYFLAFDNWTLKTIKFLLKNCKEYFYDDAKITALFGGFYNCIWEGGRCLKEDRKKDLVYAYKTIKEVNDLGISFRFTFTNPMITEEYLNDETGNNLMRIANNGMNGVIVANETLHNYLRNTYPNFHYVYSTTNCLLDVDEYNKLSKNYDILVLDYKLNKNKEALSKLTDKSKIEMLVDDCCPIGCDCRKQHYENIGKYNLGFADVEKTYCLYKKNTYNAKGKSKNFYENLIMNPYSTLKLEDIEEYKKMGFNKFKLTGRLQVYRFFADSCIYYLIKPEFKYKVKDMLQTLTGYKLYD